MIRAAGIAATLAALTSTAAPRRAAAEAAPDSAVDEAADANLESIAVRRGLTFAATLGGGLIIGFGIQDSIGRGGALSLRVGHVATRRTVITFEVGATAALHKPASGSSTQANTSTNLLAGAQHYVNPSLWVRIAGGLGVYQGRQVALPDGKLGDVTLIGPAVLGGIGVDVARFKWSVLSIETATSAMINGDGVLVAGGLNLGVSFD